MCNFWLKYRPWKVVKKMSYIGRGKIVQKICMIHSSRVPAFSSMVISWLRLINISNEKADISTALSYGYYGWRSILSKLFYVIINLFFWYFENIICFCDASNYKKCWFCHNLQKKIVLKFLNALRFFFATTDVQFSVSVSVSKFIY